jgi:hypothetical protein
MRQKLERVSPAFFAHNVIDLSNLEGKRSVSISSDVLMFRLDNSFVFIG